MIHHLSIAARDPQHVAGVLAEIMGGKAVPFPPNPGSFFALQLDDHGSGVEVYPAGTELRPGGEVGGGFVRKEPRSFGPTHFALSVTTNADTVKAIAKREGWHCFDCNRGPFHVIEVWVENEQMIEVLPPEYAAEYLAWTQPRLPNGRGAGAPRTPRPGDVIPQREVCLAALTLHDEGSISAEWWDASASLAELKRPVPNHPSTFSRRRLALAQSRHCCAGCLFWGKSSRSICGRGECTPWSRSTLCGVGS